MSKNNKRLNAFEIFSEMSSVIKENLIQEAIRMNNATKFMDSQEFEKKIRCLNNWQISEITKDIGLWQMNRSLNISFEESEKDRLKQKDADEVMEELRKKFTRGN